MAQPLLLRGNKPQGTACSLIQCCPCGDPVPRSSKALSVWAHLEGYICGFQIIDRTAPVKLQIVRLSPFDQVFGHAEVTDSSALMWQNRVWGARSPVFFCCAKVCGFCGTAGKSHLAALKMYLVIIAMSARVYSTRGGLFPFLNQFVMYMMAMTYNKINTLPDS